MKQNKISLTEATLLALQGKLQLNETAAKTLNEDANLLDKLKFYFKQDKTMTDYFNRFVPTEGMADSVGGEILRAFNRIKYRWLNDGDIYFIGHGLETAGNSACYLIDQEFEILLDGCDEIGVNRYGKLLNEKAYTALLDRAEEEIFNYLKDNPELFKTENSTDSLNFGDPEAVFEDYCFSDIDFDYDLAEQLDVIDDIKEIADQYGAKLSEYDSNIISHVKFEDVEDLEREIYAILEEAEKNNEDDEEYEENKQIEDSKKDKKEESINISLNDDGSSVVDTPEATVIIQDNDQISVADIDESPEVEDALITELPSEIEEKEVIEEEKEAKLINSESSDNEIINYIADNYEKITGRDIQSIFNKNAEGDAIFDSIAIDETSESILAELNKVGLDNKRLEDILYKLDDKLASLRESREIKPESIEEDDMDEAHEQNLKTSEDYLKTIKDIIYTAENEISFGGDFENFLNDIIKAVKDKIDEFGFVLKESENLEENLLEEEKLTESDRMSQLMNILDDTFDILEEGDALIEEAKLEEAIRLTSIPGVTRDPSSDFSDDGNRFTCYLYKEVVPISYLKADGEIYLTIALHHLNDINYDEYKEFDSYNLTDDFNGVSESSYDAEKFKQNLDAAYQDIVNFREGVEAPDDEAIEKRIAEINEAVQEVKSKLERLLQDNASNIVKLSEYGFKKLKQYMKSIGTTTADYIRESSDSSKRDFLTRDIKELKDRISGIWYYREIEELIQDASKEESVKPKFNSSSFNKIIEAYLKESDKSIETFKLESLKRKKDILKIEGKINSDKDLCLEMQEVKKGTKFAKYTLIESDEVLKENKNITSKFSLVTALNNDKILECKYFIKK